MQHKSPGKFDYNLIVIGAGSAGLVAAYIAAAVGAKVALLEKDRMGGDCLNTGCVPSKALIKSAKIISLLRRSSDFGIHTQHLQFDFADIMTRVGRVIQRIEPHDSVTRYQQLGVDCYSGEAQLITPWSVQINAITLSARSIIIATGAQPFLPPIPGLLDSPYYTSDTIWQLRHLPKRLLVLGAGPVGCELAQCFVRFGSMVTLLDQGAQILGKEDPEVAHYLSARLTQEGVDVRLSCRAIKCISDNTGHHMLCEHAGGTETLPFDAVLVAVGRSPRSQDLGLATAGVQLTSTQHVQVDHYLRTSQRNIFACGDIVDAYQFTHTASHQAWYATVNALFGWIKKFKVDYAVIPWATFTDPEIAHVGINESMAQARGIAYEISRYDISELDRAITEEEAYGFIKVLTVPGSDKILGATIVAAHAGELITEYIAAMKHGFGLNKILSTIHIYPTFSEANKFAASRWKQDHVPAKLLALAKRLHAWRRH